MTEEEEEEKKKRELIFSQITRRENGRRYIYNIICVYVTVITWSSKEIRDKRRGGTSSFGMSECRRMREEILGRRGNKHG